MKTTILLLFTIISITAHAQTTVDCSVSMKLTKALTVQERVPMSFGNLVMAGAGTATVTVGGMSTTEGLITQTGSVSPCVIDITGVANSSVYLSIPNSVSVTNGTSTMYVTALNCSDPTNVLKLDANGKNCSTIGATVTVPLSATMGEYKGNYELTFNYQ